MLPTDASVATTEPAEAEPNVPPEDRTWEKPWMNVFLRSLSRIPDKSAAARVAGVARSTYDRAAKRDPAFEAAIGEALELASDYVQRTAHTWITTGVPVKQTRTRRKSRLNAEGVLEVIEEEVTETVSAERSATLMIFWLKAHLPDTYRFADRFEHTGADGKGPVEIVVTKEEADTAAERFGASVIRLADARAAREGASGGNAG